MKYHNTKVTFGGITFDSKLEADRWAELTMLERLGAIQNLQRQVEYELRPIRKARSGRHPTRQGIRRSATVSLYRRGRGSWGG